MKGEVKKKKYLKSKNKFIFQYYLFFQHLMPKYKRSLWYNDREIGLEELRKSPGPSLSCKVLSAVCLGCGFQNLPLPVVAGCLGMSDPSVAAALKDPLLFVVMWWTAAAPLCSVSTSCSALAFPPLHPCFSQSGKTLRLQSRELLPPPAQAPVLALHTDWLLEQSCWQAENLFECWCSLIKSNGFVLCEILLLEQCWILSSPVSLAGII